MPDPTLKARQELLAWQREMLREPGVMSRAARRMQSRMNSYVPERIHAALTGAMKQMTRAVLTGSYQTTPPALRTGTLAEREALIGRKIEGYRHAAAVEGGITGAGGFFLGLADFPLLIGIKIKLLFEIAALYGHRTDELEERLYLLHIFQLAFSSDERRREVYLRLAHWRQRREQLPRSIEEFDWRIFQQEYRDYIDLAKLAQLLPVVGAPVGFLVNDRLVRKLGVAAMNAYRMRWFDAPTATAPGASGSLGPRRPG